MCTNGTEKQVRLELTKRTDELLHMILNLKQEKDVDLHRMQTLVLNMYKDELELVQAVRELELALEKKTRKAIELPNFITTKRGAQ